MRTAFTTLRRWSQTLKFKIGALCVVAALASTAVTAHFVLQTTQATTQHLLLQQEGQDRERTAGLLASKISMLHSVLTAAASSLAPPLMDDAAALAHFLTQQSALVAVFDTVLVARLDGSIPVLLQHKVEATTGPGIAERDYFKQVIQTRQPVVSKALYGKVSLAPIVVFAVPLRRPDGTLFGVLGGTLKLASTNLLSFMNQNEALDASRDIAMDSEGTILSHPDVSRILGKAQDEPDLAPVYSEWVDNGRTVHAEGTAQMSQGQLVSMAGVPAAGWMIIHMTPAAEALRPLAAARSTAWRVAAITGLSAAALAGLLAWVMTRPIGQLRGRAERLLSGSADHTEPWPNAAGEIGALSHAFQHVVEQVQQRQHETQAMLRRLEAVLHNADLGVAFTRSGRFELVSRHFCKIFMREEDTLVDQPTRLIYASDQDLQALADRARPAFLAHGAFDGEVELVRGNGEPFWAHMRGRALEPGNLTAGTIWIVEDVSHAREQRERLTWTASHDALTGLVNRAAFEVLLEQATARAAQQPFCALFIDLDRFKQVNDTAGHAAGDALLRDIARQLEAQVRRSDTVARLGGDEFAVLLAACPPAHALSIAEKLRAAVECYVLDWEGRSHSVGASIGLVQVGASFTTSAEVLRAADAACYGAKRAGRNRVVSHASLGELDVPMPVAANFSI